MELKERRENMPLYKISESVSGEEETINSDGPVQSLIKFLETRLDVSYGADSWNYDFEIERVA